MLPEAGATELIFLAAVALIVVGPKDLPVLMRKVGQWVAKMRGLAAEFRSSFDELARQSELDELRKEVEALRNTRLPDPIADLQAHYDDGSTGLEGSGLNVSHDPHQSDLPTIAAPHLQTASLEELPAAKPARAPRKPKAAAVAVAEPVPAKVAAKSKAAPKSKIASGGKIASGAKSAPQPKVAAAKPRARRASVEAKG